MKKLLIILAMMFIGCSDTGNSVAVDYDQTDVENDSTEIAIDTIDTIDTIDSIDSIDTIDSVDVVDTIDSVKDTIIDTKEDTVIVNSSSNVEDESSSSINISKEERSSSMENVVESSSSIEKLVESSSSELIVSSSSSEKNVENSSSSKIVESSSSSENEVVNSSSSVDEDYVDENEPKSTEPHYVELDELKLNGFRVENNIAYLSWENNTDYTMQINVTYEIGCDLVGVTDTTIMYTIKANSVKEKAIYEIKNNAQQCFGDVKTITATENDKSNFAGWYAGSDRGVEYISFEN